jgi:hypothetical protein
MKESRIGIKNLSIFFIFFLFFLFFNVFFDSSGIRSSQAAINMTDVRDVISSSRPGLPSDHTIGFYLTNAIPPLGQIVITPPAGLFALIPGFDYTDIDLATSTLQAGPFYDRKISSSSSATEDGININTAAGFLDNIEIILNSTNGIATGTYVEIELGLKALYEETGDRQLINASNAGTYNFQFETKNTAGKRINRSEAVIAMVEPVRMTTSQIKTRTNGTPSGTLSWTVSQTIMSLHTNYLATCRYSTASGTPYSSMTGLFQITGAYYHSYLLTGLISGEYYTYYVRCRDIYGIDDTTDFIISFVIQFQDTDIGDEPGIPGPGGSGIGGGGGGGTGQDQGIGSGQYLPFPPEPGLPGVVLTGWAYPSSDVTVLKDGDPQGLALANAQAEFGAFLEDLNQGVYTFGVWAEDPLGNKSPVYSTTFWIDDGTQTTVSDIIIPPTIALNAQEFSEGEAIVVSGYGVPGETVDVWLYGAELSQVEEDDARIKTATVSSDGKWFVSYSVGTIGNGNFKVKAKTIIELVGESVFSHALELSVGGVIESSLCSGSDLNGDGRVNLVDFSILLFYWGTDHECADQNKDGTVDLIDFSIMLYNWTG